MDLLERYLQAIGQYLPAASREDTMAELRANLLEQMDARAEELGRPLTDAEVAEVLRGHGKPEVVALRYLPQRSLIGPAVFPFYWMTLQKATPFVVFVYAIASAATLLFGHHGSGLASGIVRAVFQLIPVLLWSWAIVTIVFVIIEQVQTRQSASRGLIEWDPMKLPPVRVEGVPKPRKMGQRIVELCLHCLWMAYILWAPWHPFWIVGPGVLYLDTLGVRPAPVWHVFYLLLIVLLAMQLVVKLLVLLPETQRWIKPLQRSTDLFGAAAMGYMAWNGTYLVAADATQTLQQLAAVNHWMSVAFWIALFFAVLGLVSEGWKDIKRWVPKERVAF